MDTLFRKAAKSALYSWRLDESGLDDLVSDIWVWYLERPTTQRKLQSIAPHEVVKTVKMAALQMLSGKMLSANEFNGRNLYSSDSVKDALRGVSTNRYLIDIIPRAMEALSSQNEAYAEALRSRYEDNVFPSEKQGQNALVRAHKSLTEHVNIIAITAGVDADGNVTEGPGSRHSVFPETRPTSGGHSDPTADIAILLIEHPEVRDEYLYETPLRELLKGRAA